MASGHFTDVGMIDVAELTPNILAFSRIRAAHLGTSVTSWLTAYGCDLAAGSTNGGKKQIGKFVTDVNSDPPSNAGYMYVSGNPEPAVCAGDSGGPLFIKRSDGLWGIAAVVAAGDNNNHSWFTRLHRVRFWITDPAVNRFQHGSLGSLLNRNGNNCIGVDGVFSGMGSRLRFCDLRNLPQDIQYWSLQRIGSSNTFNIKNTLTGHCLRGERSASERRLRRSRRVQHHRGQCTMVLPIAESHRWIHLLPHPEHGSFRRWSVHIGRKLQ